MKILTIIPPYVPSYFNAGHHLPVFQVAAYLRKAFPSATVNALDAAALNLTWKEICDLLVSKFDIIAVLNDFDCIDGFERFTTYVRRMSPSTKLITFGRLGQMIPKFFFKLNFDAVVCNGDSEAGVANYISSPGTGTLPGGVLLSTSDNIRGGNFLPAEEWALPDIREIPYESYTYLYKNDMNKFCGIPGRQELVVPVSRGCPLGCHFCDVWKIQGTKERRLTVEHTIQYIKESFEQAPFEYYSFYSPTFTLNKRWVLQFCETIKKESITYRWKCPTVLALLDEPLIATMASSGCVRISIGVETLGEASRDLPKLKRQAAEQLKIVAKACHEHGVELNCFIILGLPNDTPEKVHHSIKYLRSLGARIRPTIYTPYHLLRDDMTLSEVNQFNRQLFAPNLIPQDMEQEYYKIFYADAEDSSTTTLQDRMLTSV